MHLIETLESRQLLSGSTSGLPSLTGVLTVKKTTIAGPDQQVTATLKITNGGGDITKTTVPIGIYATDGLITTLNPSLTIKNGKSKNLPIKVTIPIGTTLPNGSYNFTAIINDGNTVPEATGTDGNANATLFNPVGTYTGTYQVGTDSESLDINVFSSDGKLLSDVTADGETFGSISSSNAKTTIAGNGKITVLAKGSDNAHNVSTFTLNIKGTLNTSNGSISGPFSASGKSTDGPFKAHGTFSLTESATY
jgi:hypothetical protein